MKVVFFDLDGTLVCLDKPTFTKRYIDCLSNYVTNHGYENRKLVTTFFDGNNEMKKNNGQKTNEEIFWKVFENAYGKELLKDKPLFENFYNNNFNEINSGDISNSDVVNLVKHLKNSGYKLVVASNPVFPLIAQKKRIEWAGLNPEDFDFITSYETMHYSKPSLNYYEEITKILNIKKEDCLMVGNDVIEDMAAKELGMKVFLVTPFIENKNNEDISKYPNGDFKKLLEFINNNF